MTYGTGVITIDQPTTETADRAVYTVKEISKLLGLTLNPTYALVRAGTIPAVKLGGRWVVPKDRFHAWLNHPAHTDAATDTTPTGGAR